MILGELPMTRKAIKRPKDSTIMLLAWSGSVLMCCEARA